MAILDLISATQTKISSQKPDDFGWKGEKRIGKEEKDIQRTINKQVSNYPKSTYAQGEVPALRKKKYVLKSGRVYFILQINFSVPRRLRKSITKSDN